MCNGYIIYDPTMWPSGKSKIMGTVKGSGLLGGEGRINRGSAGNALEQ